MLVSNKKTSTKKLSVFSLTMINVIVVDSLRTLTAGAEYGFALVFFYALASLLFFIPTILVSAELATAWPNTGGVYIWVREAFGLRWGFLVIWLQWVYNIVWYPTIFAFIAAVLAYAVDPQLATNKAYLLTVVLVLFWGTTFINCCGIHASSLLSTLAAIVGTILPLFCIIILGLVWMMSGKPSAIFFSWSTFFPHLTDIKNIAFLTTITFSLMGMEMSAVHAGDVQDPKRDYPRALAYSAVLIVIPLICASLAIATVVPVQQLNLLSGLLDAFVVFFKAYHMDWAVPVIAGLIVLGSLGNAGVWIGGPCRGLHIASQENQLPVIFQKTNRYGMPVGILLLQAIIFTLLCSLFVLMPTINASYWILSVLTAQLGLMFYILMFAAAIRLRYKMPNTIRAYKIPGGKAGMWMVSGIGIITCFIAIIIGFLPPPQVQFNNVALYETLLIVGLLIFCAPVFFIQNHDEKA